MDIRSPRLLKIKGGLFLTLGVAATGLLCLEVWPLISWKVILLGLLAIWAFCRTYYFGFYVLEHYADPTFRYAGLLDLCLYLTGLKTQSQMSQKQAAPTAPHRK